MASQALYRKWRSQTFDEVVGQQHVIQTLSNALELGRVAHAYLFSGPRGTGKTTTARLLAKAVNCQHDDQAIRPCNECHICTAINEARLLDLIEIDAASNTGVDDIRDLRDKVGFRPSEAKIKFYIIDEVHMLSNSAFNALLKTLEEPPGHVIFVLATTEPEKIPATITSRCQRFDFKRIKLDAISQHLEHIARHEGVEAEGAALDYIARQSGGSMRDAISLLDQLIAYGSGSISLELVQTVLGSVTSQSVISLTDAIIDQDVAAGLDVINQVVGDGVDPRQMAREVVEYLRALMLVKLGNGADTLNLPQETLTSLKAQAAKTDAATIVRATSLFNKATSDIKSALLTIPQLPLELAFVEVTTGSTEPVSVSSPSMPSTVATAAPPPSFSRPSPPPPAASLPISQVPVAVDDSDLTVDTVRGCFTRVLQEIEMKNKVMAEALRTQTRLYKVAGNQIYFVTVEVMKERFEKPQPQSALNDAFSRIIGRPVSIHFMLDSETSDQSQTNKQTNEDHLIELVKVAEDLGGQVVEE